MPCIKIVSIAQWLVKWSKHFKKEHSKTKNDLILDMTDGRSLDKYKLINLRNVVFVNPLQDGHKCSKCQQLLQFPKQTSCGHRYCEECIFEEMLRFCS